MRGAELAKQIKEATEVAKDPLGAAATDHLAELGITDAKGKDDWGRQKKKRMELAQQGKVPYRAQAAQQQARRNGARQRVCRQCHAARWPR